MLGCRGTKRKGDPSSLHSFFKESCWDSKWWSLCSHGIGVNLGVWCSGDYQYRSRHSGYPGCLSLLLAGQRFHIDLFLGLFITIPIMFALGVFIEWAFIRRLKWDRITLSILVTFAIAVIIEGVLTYFFTGNLVILQTRYTEQSVYMPFINYYMPLIYIYAFILSVVLLVGLYFIVYRTSFGRCLRASMQNRTAASLIGSTCHRYRQSPLDWGQHWQLREGWSSERPMHSILPFPMT